MTGTCDVPVRQGGIMKKMVIFLYAAVLFFGTIGNAPAFFIDFENGTNGAAVSDIAGVSFHDFNGYAPLYGDSGTGLYNTTSDDLGLSWKDKYFHHDGYFWLWAGKKADARGVVIDFDKNDGTWFTTGYNSYASFYLEAHLTDGTMVSMSGASNVMNPMDYLTVHAKQNTFIDYIILRHDDEGNSWLADNMSGDASGVGEIIPDPVPATSNPEPSAILLFGIGLLCFAGIRYLSKGIHVS